MDAVARRLEEHGDVLEVVRVDPLADGALDQVLKSSPTLVMLDTRDTDIERNLPLNRLLSALCDVQLLLLDSLHTQVQFVTCEGRQPAEVDDLIRMVLERA